MRKIFLTRGGQLTAVIQSMTEMGENTIKGIITIIYAEDQSWFREPTVEMLVESGFDVVGALNDGK